jgi:hypothetical protein
VLIIGIPFQYTLSKILKARLAYMKEKYQIDESDFLTFDALRQTSQCMGRVIRSKQDYGIMILADQRYARADKRQKLPGWIREEHPPPRAPSVRQVHVPACILRGASCLLLCSAPNGFLLHSPIPLKQYMQDNNVNLSTDMAVQEPAFLRPRRAPRAAKVPNLRPLLQATREFLAEMSKPQAISDQIGKARADFCRAF